MNDKIIWVCAECGSENVHVKQWVELNYKDIIYWELDLDKSDTYCNTCEEHTGIVEKSEYEAEEQKAADALLKMKNEGKLP